MARSMFMFAGMGLAGVASAQEGSTTTDDGAMTTDAPDFSNPCAPVAAFLEECESETYDFDNFQLATQASCLCYGWINSDVWEPSIYDQAFQTCSAYLSTADPGDYSDVVAGYGTITAPCAAAGNVAEAKSTDTYGLSDFIATASSAVEASPGITASDDSASATPAAVITEATAGNSLFPTASGGSGVRLTPGTASGTSMRTPLGGEGTAHSTGAAGSAGSAGSAQSSGLAGNVRANSGLLAGLVALVAAL